MVGFEKESAALSCGRVIGSDLAMIFRTARALSVKVCCSSAADGGMMCNVISRQLRASHRRPTSVR